MGCFRAPHPFSLRACYTVGMRPFALVLLLIGCASGPELELERLRGRTQLDCGTLPDACPADAAQAVDCVNQALRDGHHASLSWTRTTVEGDPIVHWVFVDGENLHLRSFVDTRADAFGPKALTASWCDGLALTGAPCAFPSPTGCQP